MNSPKPLSLNCQRFRLCSLEGSPRKDGKEPCGPASILSGRLASKRLLTHSLAYIGIGVSLWTGPVLPLALARSPETDSSLQAAHSGLLAQRNARDSRRSTPGKAPSTTADLRGRPGHSTLTPSTTNKSVGSRKASETPSDLLLQRPGERQADALAAFAEGIAAEDNANLERAMEAYRRALALDPSNIELAVKVAFELARRGDIPQGIDLLKDAEKAAPKDYLPPLCLSQIYGKYLKKNDLAERYALRALAIEPESFPPYLALFEIYTSTKQNKKADAIVAKAAKMANHDPMFWLQVAEIYSRMGMKEKEIDPKILPKVTEALEKAYETALIPHSKRKRARKTTGEEKELTPQEERDEQQATLVKIADFYILLQQLKSAIPIYQKVISESKNLASPEVLVWREKLARCLLAEGERGKAISMLEAIIKESPARYDLYEFLGELYSLGGQEEMAIHAYKQALLFDASQPNSFLRIADLQIQTHNPEGAVETLRNAIRTFPRHLQVVFSLALALREAKQYAQSLVYFKQAEQVARDTNQSELNSLFYFAYGVAAEQAGKPEQAAELLAKSIELDPSSAANAYNYLGYMWAEKGARLEEALQLINRALALEPENPAYIDSLGWCYYQMGRYQEAIVHLEKAAEMLQPEDPIVFEHLGDARLALGETAPTLEAWRRALTLNPRNKELAEKLRKLEEGEVTRPTPPTAVAQDQGAATSPEAQEKPEPKPISLPIEPVKPPAP